MNSIEAAICSYISEQLDQNLPKLVSEWLKHVQPLPVWMTEIQLAEYWQLRNKNGEITVHSIRNWTNRPRGEHPLPCANMGEMRRYHREEVDTWAREEAERQRARKAVRVNEEVRLKAVEEVAD